VGALVDKLEEMVSILIDLMKSQKKCTVEIQSVWRPSIVGEDVVIIKPIVSAAGKWSMVGFLTSKEGDNYTLFLKQVKRISWEEGEFTREPNLDVEAMEQINKDFVKAFDLLLKHDVITEDIYRRWVFGERPHAALREMVH
jgi:hypothetical protein